MTIVRGFAIVLLSAMLFGLLGALVGYIIGVVSPDYYAAIFSFRGRSDMGSFGIGIGLAQGIVAGIVVGLVIVVAVTWYESRKLLRDMMRIELELDRADEAGK